MKYDWDCWLIIWLPILGPSGQSKTILKSRQTEAQRRWHSGLRPLRIWVILNWATKLRSWCLSTILSKIFMNSCGWNRDKGRETCVLIVSAFGMLLFHGVSFLHQSALKCSPFSGYSVQDTNKARGSTIYAEDEWWGEREEGLALHLLKRKTQSQHGVTPARLSCQTGVNN